ncbi:4-phosphoerythronate dehydrogenase [Ferrimonas sediminicola]|uniref:Erythronate-4-phosphate dehydrogenase n=1 Tax=Ferrimonas sediminicola TaxID=2569538 RepID=A0A4U1BFF3_9GAMM|nr:4-phosphoerythronate dehydrogenase [Ferrimonas sediminicola]TKB49847.1 4-phosphoerythronate dehydrogenase [Ferrimonas sediminicola]
MIIVADENMPALDAMFGGHAEIRTYPGREIGPDQVGDAEILLVRSVTRVDPALIEAAPRLKFVGTATIGFDHIDTRALEARGISWSNAPGCNAEAVGEYVLTALLTLAERLGVPLKGRTLGVIGAGNTGSATAARAAALGMRVLLNDPPKQRGGDPRAFVDLGTLLTQSDVVCCHVPLSRQGADATFHLLDAARLGLMKANAWLVNACRGEVVDNGALIAHKRTHPECRLILDVWEGEPNPMAELVALAEIATPHIAGYSVEAKLRGNWLLLSRLGETLALDEVPPLTTYLPQAAISTLGLSAPAAQSDLARVARLVYDIDAQDRRFREWSGQVGGFDRQRKAHLERREFMSLTIVGPAEQAALWSQLGFNTRENLHGTGL